MATAHCSHLQLSGGIPPLTAAPAAHVEVSKSDILPKLGKGCRAAPCHPMCTAAHHAAVLQLWEPTVLCISNPASVCSPQGNEAGPTSRRQHNRSNVYILFLLSWPAGRCALCRLSLQRHVQGVSAPTVLCTEMCVPNARLYIERDRQMHVGIRTQALTFICIHPHRPVRASLGVCISMSGFVRAHTHTRVQLRA